MIYPLVDHYNVMDERLKKNIGQAEGEFNKKYFRREFIKCFTVSSCNYSLAEIIELCSLESSNTFLLDLVESTKSFH